MQGESAVEIEYLVDATKVKNAKRLAEFRRLQLEWDNVNPLITRISFVQYCQMQDILDESREEHHTSERYRDQIHAIESTFILLKFCNLLVVRHADTGNETYEPEMLARMLGKELKLSDAGCNRLKGLFSYYIATSENRLNDTFVKGKFVSAKQLVDTVGKIFDDLQERLSTRRIKTDVASESLTVLTTLLESIDTTAGKLLCVMIGDQRKKLVGKNKQVSFRIF